MPASADLSMTRIYVVALIAVGAFWTLFSWYAVGGVAKGNIVATAFAMLFPGLGLVILFTGVLALIRKRHVTFDKTGVKVNDRRIFGRGTWSLPYSAFEGVLYRERVVNGKNSTTVYQIIELRHSEPDKTIPLYIKATEEVPRRKWEEYARKLDLPALSESAGQILTRLPEELDMSIHQLAQQGRIKVEHDDGEPPPKGLVVTRDHMEGEPVLNIGITVPRLPYWVPGVFLGIPVFLTVVGLTTPDSLYITMFAVAFLLLGGMVFVPDWRTGRDVEITKTFITATDPLNRNEGQSLTMKLEDIEEIAIARPRSQIGHEVVMISDDDQISVGAGLPKASLHWLRNYLIAAIARA